MDVILELWVIQGITFSFFELVKLAEKKKSREFIIF